MIPEWATHIAVDANGEVWAFEGEPVWDKSPAAWIPVDDFDGLRFTLIPLTGDVAAILCARIPRPEGWSPPEREENVDDDT